MGIDMSYYSGQRNNQWVQISIPSKLRFAYKIV